MGSPIHLSTMAGDGNLITLRREWTRAGGSRSRHPSPGICSRPHAGLYHLRSRHSGPWVLDSGGSAGKTPLAPPRHLRPTNRSPLCPFLPASSAQPRVGVSLGWVTRPGARAQFPESTWPAGPPQRPALGHPGCSRRFQNHPEEDAHCAPYGQCPGLWSLPGPVLEQTRAGAEGGWGRVALCPRECLREVPLVSGAREEGRGAWRLLLAGLLCWASSCHFRWAGTKMGPVTLSRPTQISLVLGLCRCLLPSLTGREGAE